MSKGQDIRIPSLSARAPYIFFRLVYGPVRLLSVPENKFA